MRKRRFIPFLLTLAVLFLLAGCTAASTDDGYTPNATPAPTAPAEAMPQEDTGGEAESQAALDGGVEEETAEGPGLSLPQDDRMVILNANLTIEALDFTSTCNAIEQATEQAGGYISYAQINTESSTMVGRDASFTIRVPVEHYTDFLAAAGEAGNITTRNESSDDVTSAYVDLEARLNSLRTQEARLLELMEQAGDLTDLLTIQDQLTDVQYEIESYTAQKNAYDQLIAYSTIDIYVYEVVELTQTPPESYLERIGRAFTESWANFANFFKELSIALVYILPALLVLAAIAVVIIVVVARSRKKHRGKQPVPPPAAENWPGQDAYNAYYYGYAGAWPPNESGGETPAENTACPAASNDEVPSGAAGTPAEREDTK